MSYHTGGPRYDANSEHKKLGVAVFSVHLVFKEELNLMLEILDF